MTPQSKKEFKVPMTNSNDYGMDLNSDDSTDDESQPRKPVPAWATGMCGGMDVCLQHLQQWTRSCCGVLPSSSCLEESKVLQHGMSNFVSKTGQELGAT